MATTFWLQAPSTCPAGINPAVLTDHDCWHKNGYNFLNTAPILTLQLLSGRQLSAPHFDALSDLARMRMRAHACAERRHDNHSL